MKKFYSIILTVAFILSACSVEVDIPDIPEFENLPDSCYINIDLLSPTSVHSRELSDEDLVDGSDDENKISKVRFYFFNDNGDPVNIQYPDAGLSQVSFCDYEPSDEDIKDSSDKRIEKILSTVLSFKIEDKNFPTQVIAIVNPDSSLDDLKYVSVSELQDIVLDLLTDHSSAGKFIMSNSVYADNSDSESGSANRLKMICPAQILSSQISTNPEEAVKNPVDIYVERAVARLDVSFSNNLTKKTLQNIGSVFDTGLYFSPADNPALNEKIYLKFIGWAVTSTPSVSRLLKKINLSWDPGSFFDNKESWNFPRYFRSVWAINPDFSQVGNSKDIKDFFLWYSYSDLIADENSRKNGVSTANIDKSTTYMQENANPHNNDASPANPDYPTKVIFAAQLIDKNGNPISIAEYESEYYTPEGLKKLVADMLDMYRQNGHDSNGNQLYEKIKPEHLDFETSKEHRNPYGPDSEGSYYVFFKLSDSGLSCEWYHLNGSQSGNNPVKVNNPSEYLSLMTYPVKIWNQGYSYYYFDIPHCQSIDKTKPGHFGVVRNNIYNAVIESISSLGTPVYNPDEVIFPETPENETQLIITVNTSPWRLIKKKFQFTW